MEDREVGIIWKTFQDCRSRGTDDEATNACLLVIRKLVEERAAVLFNEEPHGHAEIWRYCVNEKLKNEYRDMALRQFNISPDDWGKENP